MKNIVFMGTPSYASKILEEIYKAKFNILAIYTQPDKPVGRSQALTPPDVKKLAIDLGLNDIVYQPKSLKDSGVKEHIKSLNPDIIIVAAYGQILPRDILDIAPCVNLHASILPAYRGASPIQSAILDKNSLSGITAMAMNEGLDSGDILAFSILDITGMNSYELFDKLSIMAANLTIKVLNEYKNINPIKQFDALSSKCKKIKKDDGLVDFSVDSASQIWAKFLAYYGWPGIFTKNGIKQSFFESRISEADRQKCSYLALLPKIWDDELKGVFFVFYEKEDEESLKEQIGLLKQYYQYSYLHK